MRISGFVSFVKDIFWETKKQPFCCDENFCRITLPISNILVFAYIYLGDLSFLAHLGYYQVFKDSSYRCCLNVSI